MGNSLSKTGRILTLQKAKGQDNSLSEHLLKTSKQPEKRQSKQLCHVFMLPSCSLFSMRTRNFEPFVILGTCPKAAKCRCVPLKGPQMGYLLVCNSQMSYHKKKILTWRPDSCLNIYPSLFMGLGVPMDKDLQPSCQLSATEERSLHAFCDIKVAPPMGAREACGVIAAKLH